MLKKKRSSASNEKSLKTVNKKPFILGGILGHIPGLKSLKKLNRNVVLATSLAAILVLAGLFSILLHNNTQDEIADNTDSGQVTEIESVPTMKATLTIVEGVVEYTDESEDTINEDSWKPASKDLDILPKMSLRTTGAASRAAISLADGSIVRIGASTAVTFQAISETRVIVLQQKGQVYSRVSENQSRSYTVQTKNSQFEAAGTAFKTLSGGDAEAVEVYDGSVQETSINKKAFSGEKLTVKSFVNSKNDQTITKLSIEDIKNDQFTMWNREQDASNENYKNKLGFLSDIIAPEISITNPVPDSTIEVDSNATEGSIEIEGKTERGAKLTVESKSVAGSGVINVEVSGEGTFKTPVLRTAIGNSVFQFIATDKTGNKTTLSTSLLFKKKSVVQQQGIALTINSTSTPGKLLFAWGLVGMTTPDGVKLVYSDKQDPSYPDDELEYIESDSSATITISSPNPFKSDKTYYFRVCRYIETQDNCDVYSNQVSFKIP